MQDLISNTGAQSLLSFIDNFISRIDINIKKELLGNFVLSGGLSNMVGLGEFLSQKLAEKNEVNCSINFQLNQNINRSY